MILVRLVSFVIFVFLSSDLICVTIFLFLLRLSVLIRAELYAIIIITIIITIIIFLIIITIIIIILLSVLIIRGSGAAVSLTLGGNPNGDSDGGPDGRIKCRYFGLRITSNA